MSRLFEKQYAPLVVLIISAGALATAFVAQYLFDLPPCKLCIYQRWPFALAIGFGFLGHSWRNKSLFLTIITALLAITLAVNSGIAIFHVGVEQGWWLGLSGCTAEVGSAKTIEQLRAQILNAPIVRCDEIAWSLFGISMAGYNALLCAALATFSGSQLFRKES